MRIKDKPNKVKAKLTVEVEAEFYDYESNEETIRYCVEQDLEDAGLNVIDVSVDNTTEKLLQAVSKHFQNPYCAKTDIGKVMYEKELIDLIKNNMK